MKSALLLLCLGMLGCAKPPDVKPTATSTANGILIVKPLSGAVSNPPRPRNGIAELRALAKSRKQHWRIFCTAWNEDERQQYLADLCEADCDLIYAEDGAGLVWDEWGRDRNDAALNLVNDVLRGDGPNDQEGKFNHRYSMSDKMKGKQCLPEISDKTDAMMKECKTCER